MCLFILFKFIKILFCVFRISDGYWIFMVKRCVTQLQIPEFYSTASAVQNTATIHLIQLPDPCLKIHGHVHTSVYEWTLLHFLKKNFIES